MIKIIVDTLGGDNSPHANIDGAIMALNRNPNVYLILSGDEQVIKEYLENKTYDKKRLEILSAPDVVTCNDKPTEVIKCKPDSSLVKSFELLRNSEDINAFVSTGSTGALLAGAVLRLGRIKGVKRPAFCPILPTVSGGIVSICDSGANSDCTSEMLNQFAVMGSLYLKSAYGIKCPRVALLNIGTEEEKGDLLRKETFPLLKDNKNVNFVGNMEARELLNGNVDLVVCDGFSGNVLLKSTEGACLELLHLIKKTFLKNLKTKIGALLIKKDMKDIKGMLDYNNHGGAVLLGAKKTIVKGHGSSKALSVYHCIEQAYNMEKNGLRGKIEKSLNEVTNEE